MRAGLVKGEEISTEKKQGYRRGKESIKQRVEKETKVEEGRNAIKEIQLTQ